MREYQICKRCVMDTTDPEIVFDERGYCHHCNGYFKGLASRKPASVLELKLKRLVERIKKRGAGKEYDCVMGLSGGCDSSYLAFKVVELGLRPLTLHFDSGWNTETSTQNIERVVKKLDLDLYTIVCDWEEMRDLQRSFFRASLVNCDTPQDHAFIAALYQITIQRRVHYWVGGHDYLGSESILPLTWRGYDSRDWRHIRGVHRLMGGKPLKRYPHFNLFKLFVAHPLFYRIKPINLFSYSHYDKVKAKEFLVREVGWKDYTGKHNESVFTRFFQGYYLPKKFGYDKRKAHLSSLVVSGQISRDDALKELSTPFFSEEQSQNELEYVLKKLGFTQPEWDAIMALPPKDEQAYPNNRKWLDLHFKLDFKIRSAGGRIKRRLVGLAPSLR